MQMTNNKGNRAPRSFYATVLALVVPMALQNLINVATQSADVLMLGRVGEIALSASSLAGQVQYVMTLIFFGIGSGASVLTAQYWGKGDMRSIEKVMSIALRLSLSISFVFFVAAMAIPGTLMQIFTPEAEVIAEGVIYLRLVAVSYLFMGFTNIYLLILRSVEKVVVSTLVYFISFFTNVIANAVLIFGLLGFPAMGIAGAAIATTLARAVELVITLVYAGRFKLLRLRLKDFTTMPKDLWHDFIKYSGPTTLNEMFWGLAIACNSVIIGHMGASAVAANSVAQVMRQLAMVICFGLANATAIMVGKAIGSGDKALAQDYAGRFMKLTLATGLGGGAVIFSIRPLVIRLMELSPEAEKYLSFLLLIMSVYVIVQSLNTTMVVGVFRGGGETKFGLYADIGSMWLGSLLWGSLAAFVFGAPVEVVYTIIMLDEFIKFIPILIRYRQKKWLRDVTR